MDRRVKERLVGASILAFLLVLIVPEFLSGPAPNSGAPKMPVSTPEPIRNVTVDFATSKQAQSEPAENAAADPAAGRTPPAAPRAASSAPFDPQAPSETATPLETPASPPTSGSSRHKPAAAHAWAVQLGSFASRANADKLVRQVKGQGFAVYVLPGGSGPSLRYRVRVGPLADRAGATQALAKLKSLGHGASLAPPGS